MWNALSISAVFIESFGVIKLWYFPFLNTNKNPRKKKKITYLCPLSLISEVLMVITSCKTVCLFIWKFQNLGPFLMFAFVVFHLETFYFRNGLSLFLTACKRGEWKWFTSDVKVWTTMTFAEKEEWNIIMPKKKKKKR